MFKRQRANSLAPRLKSFSHHRAGGTETPHGSQMVGRGWLASDRRAATLIPNTTASATKRQITAARKFFVRGIRPTIHLTAQNAGEKKNRIARSTAFARSTVIPMTRIYRHNSQVNHADNRIGNTKTSRKTKVWANHQIRHLETSLHIYQLKPVQASKRNTITAVFVRPPWSQAAPAKTRL